MRVCVCAPSLCHLVQECEMTNIKLGATVDYVGLPQVEAGRH